MDIMLNYLKNQFYINDDKESLYGIQSIYPQLSDKEEVWALISNKVIPGVYEKYYISTYGRVYSLFRNTFLTPVETKNGYYRVFLRHEDNRGLYHLLHRIVMKTFSPIFKIFLSSPALNR